MRKRCGGRVFAGLVVAGLALVGGCGTVADRLDIAASPSEGGAPLTVAFTTAFAGTAGTYEWEFGDGATSAERNPTHTYESPGLYTVRLTVVAVQGPAVTVTKVGMVRVTGGAASPLLFWGDRGTGHIARGERAGTRRETIVAGLISPEDLAVASGRIYWVDSGAGTVEVANIDGMARQLLASGQNYPTGVAVDRLRGKVYWTCLPSGTGVLPAREGTIMRANLDGSGAETLKTFAPSEPFAWQIALDCVAEKLYWISLSWDALNAGTCDAAIVAAGLDAMQQATLVSGLCHPTDLTTDGSALQQAEYVYWTSEDPGALLRVAVGGGGVATLVAGIADAESLAVDPDEGRIYWTAGTVLQSAGLDGAGVTTVFAGLNLPEGMAIDR